MSDYSGLVATQPTPKRGVRYLANWRARYFLEDRKILFATVGAIYKKGFTLHCDQCLPVGATMNLEFLVRYKELPTKIRIKGRVDYCLLKTSGEGAEVDVTTLKISHDHQHMVNNLIQILSSSKEFNLRI